MDVDDLKHFRTVSNLPFLGPLIEKVAVAQTETYMNESGLHELFQLAYCMAQPLYIDNIIESV